MRIAGKHLLAIVAAVCLAAPFQTAEAADKPVKILISAKNMADPFYSWLCNSTVEALRKARPDAEYKVVDLMGDPANTQQLIDQAVLEDYDALIFDKVNHGQNTDAMLREAKRQGLSTVITNFSGGTDGVSSSSGASNYLLGNQVGAKAAELLPKNAKICVVLSSPADTGSDDRWRGYQDALKEAGRDDIEILDVKNNDGWAKEKAMRLMDDWLQIYPGIDGILAMNDGMALGCIESCKADGRDLSAMQFYGIDGLGDACISIEANELTASVLQDAMDMGTNAIRIALGMIDGSITTEEYLIKPIVITKGNVQEIIAIHKANGAL